MVGQLDSEGNGIDQLKLFKFRMHIICLNCIEWYSCANLSQKFQEIFIGKIVNKQNDDEIQTNHNNHGGQIWISDTIKLSPTLVEDLFHKSFSDVSIINDDSKSDNRQ